MEALIHGGSRLHVHISILFNLFIKFSYVPKSLMKCVIIPFVKCKSDDLTDVNNYRAIAISTAISKLFESVLSSFVVSSDDVDAYQFGFKSGHSTSLCTNVFKNTIDYYTGHGSHVFTCFIDFTKAFDRVNYWKLFNKLLDDNCNVAAVKLIAYWYSYQEVCVNWHNTVSEFFTLGNGTRQGGVLSPRFFARYIRELLMKIAGSDVGCNVGGMMMNILAYADDIVLMAPSWRGLQFLLDMAYDHICEIDMIINTAKSVCMVFSPRDRSKVVCSSFPLFRMGRDKLQYVNSLRYLGHRIVDSNNDDDDILREISNMFVRTNILIRRSSKCSISVKTGIYIDCTLSGVLLVA